MFASKATQQIFLFQLNSLETRVGKPSHVLESFIDLKSDNCTTAVYVLRRNAAWNL